jgi:hypothetical protein
MTLGAFLGFLALAFIYDLFTAALGTPAVQSGLLLIGCFIAVLAWMWSKLPEWFRKFIRKRLRRRRDRHAEE